MSVEELRSTSMLFIIQLIWSQAWCDLVNFDMVWLIHRQTDKQVDQVYKVVAELKSLRPKQCGCGAGRPGSGRKPEAYAA